MADVTETRQLYDPQLTGSRTALLSSVDKLGAGLASQLQNYTGLDVSQFAPQIAGQDALQTGAVTAAGGLVGEVVQVWSSRCSRINCFIHVTLSTTSYGCIISRV